MNCFNSNYIKKKEIINQLSELCDCHNDVITDNQISVYPSYMFCVHN